MIGWPASCVLQSGMDWQNRTAVRARRTVL